jgi:two-component system sensor histidine kinase KdpD
MAVARWASDHGEPAGRGTDTLPSASGYYLPLAGGRGAVGVLALRPHDVRWPLPPAQANLLETFANGLGLALERAQLAKESHEARISAESQKLRNSLLSSISHDLRTPLTSIAGAASALVSRGGDAPELAQTIYHEALRLNLQVQNLLDMTRLHSGEVTPNLDWHALEEIVGTALSRTRELLGDRPLALSLPADLPLLRLDAALVEKLVVNLLENAAAHTPTGTPIEVTGRAMSETVWLVVADRGPGIAPGQEAAIFERFAQAGPKGQGLGLGLAICRAIARLHQARVWARNRAGGGAEFIVEFPRPAEQPSVPEG